VSRELPIEAVEADAVVIGTGVAGLAAALGLAPRRVHLITKAALGRGGSSVWAQGGVAVAVGPSDTPELHAADTVAAGAGLVEEEMAELLARDGVAAIRELVRLGAEFDRAPSGELALGREAAHSRSRIVHAHGDQTGAEMVRALGRHVARESSITLFESAWVTRLAMEQERVVGVETRGPDGRRLLHVAPRVVLATGGCGQIWRHTTNPREATGDGLALAAAAGATLVDLEFVQFHPTALAVPGLDPAPLLTEALRGEGSILIDDAGERFMTAEHAAAELAPRDVVARAIWKRLAAGRRVFLDARAAVGERFPRRFPTVFESCRAAGIDPRGEPMPVTPAAHYHMGGVAVDAWGRASLPGLWACGEVASTGVHGANRLASNSLLEALVFGGRVAESAGGDATTLRPAPTLAAQPDLDPAAAAPAVREEVRDLAWRRLGLERDGDGLAAALDRLHDLHRGLPPGPSEARAMVTVAWLVAAAAELRRESRGAHYRTDQPRPDEAWRVRLLARPAVSDDALAVRFEPAAELEAEERPLAAVAP